METGQKELPIRKLAVCEECGRRFDLTDETDSADWFYGHDCEGE